MILNKILIDTNVCLDAAQKRNPFDRNSLQIIEESENGMFSGIIAAHGFDTLFYILTNKNTKKEAYTVIDGLRRAFDVAPVTESIIDAARNLEWSDFEDAIHYQAALSAGCDAIVTRNEKDFKNTNLPVLSPHRFLQQLKEK